MQTNSQLFQRKCIEFACSQVYNTCMETIRPCIFISRCLGFEHCRWNGEMITDDFVERLKSSVDVIHACPEMAIGLGCPRDPVRVVMINGVPELYQPASGKAWGASMRAWASDYIPTLPANIDGFILKSRSPSCGWKDVKVYHSVKPESGAGIGAGLFGSAVLTAFGTRPIEDEGRLKNFVIRERFLGAIFTLARFRIVEQSGDPAALVEFHTRHKYFLMLYSEKEMRALGRIVANHEHLALPEVLCAYRAGLERASRNAALHRAHQCCPACFRRFFGLPHAGGKTILPKPYRAVP